MNKSKVTVVPQKEQTAKGRGNCTGEGISGQAVVRVVFQSFYNNSTSIAAFL
jgi:hypothetical protein